MEDVHLEHLSLRQFKSYDSGHFQFGEGFQLLIGANGMGKTNVLDALYYLGMCRSYFSLRDRELVRHGEAFFRLEAAFRISAQSFQVVAKVKPGDSKVFELNRKPYDTLADHIGRVPVVLIAPNDTQLLTGFSEERRRFLDQTLCQVDQDYLRNLVLYNRLLTQRNAWLKSVSAQPSPDLTLLETFDHQMEEPARRIHIARQRFAGFLSERTAVLYAALCEGREIPAVDYRSPLDGQEWSALLRRQRSADLRQGRTTEGVHRDDLELRLDGHPARRFGSQGQLKSYVLALKLAQYQYMAEARSLMPVLLMDDIFDKLDRHRVQALIALLAGKGVGQVFITDTEEDRVAGVLRSIHQPYTTFRISNSRILPSDPQS
jgi:DNA replication and repair protein RecF